MKRCLTGSLFLLACVRVFGTRPTQLRWAKKQCHYRHLHNLIVGALADAPSAILIVRHYLPLVPDFKRFFFFYFYFFLKTAISRSLVYFPAVESLSFSYPDFIGNDLVLQSVYDRDRVSGLGTYCSMIARVGLRMFDTALDGLAKQERERTSAGEASKKDMDRGAVALQIVSTTVTVSFVDEMMQNSWIKS